MIFILILIIILIVIFYMFDLKTVILKQIYPKMTVAELKKLAKEKNIEGYSTMKKAELIDALK